MNKFIVSLCVSAIAISPLYCDQQKRDPRTAPQPRLFDMKIQEFKETKLSKLGNKNAAWGANIVGKTTGTLYSIEARLTTPVLLFTDSFHKKIYTNEKKRRENWVKWLGQEHSQKDKRDIALIAELSSLQGHRYAYHYNVEGWAFLSANKCKQEAYSPELKKIINDMSRLDGIPQF